MFISKSDKKKLERNLESILKKSKCDSAVLMAFDNSSDVNIKFFNNIGGECTDHYYFNHHDAMLIIQKLISGTTFQKLALQSVEKIDAFVRVFVINIVNENNIYALGVSKGNTVTLDNEDEDIVKKFDISKIDFVKILQQIAFG